MRFGQTVFLTAAVIATPATAHAKAATSVKAPVLTPGDTWTYTNGNVVRGVRRVTHDIATLTRASSQLTVVEVHSVDQSVPGSEHLFGPDWSRVRSVNGVQTVVNKPLAFPLSPGKTWSLSYAENTPADRTHTRESYELTYKVAGWEDVTVPAGTFHALKIEGDGTWTAYLPGNVLVTKGRAANGATISSATGQAPRVASGRLLKTFWYVPEVHRWVKSEEDTFNSGGVQTQQATSELEAYTLANAPAAEAPEADAQPESEAQAPERHAKADGRAPRKAPAAPPTQAAPAPAPAPASPLLREMRLLPDSPSAEKPPAA